MRLLLYDAAYEGYISEPGDPPLHLRNSRRARMRDRVSQLLQDRRLHRRALRIHRHAEELCTRRRQDGRSLPLHPLWHRRWSTKANGVSYPVQRGAEALYSDAGRSAGPRADRALHGQRPHPARGRERARGGSLWRDECSLHLGARRPAGLTSWEMFDRMLQQLHVVITPGQRLWLVRRRVISASPPSTAAKTRGSGAPSADALR